MNRSRQFLYINSYSWAKSEHLPMEASKGADLRAGFMVDKVEVELSEPFVFGEVMSLGRQDVVEPAM